MRRATTPFVVSVAVAAAPRGLFGCSRAPIPVAEIGCLVDAQTDPKCPGHVVPPPPPQDGASGGDASGGSHLGDSCSTQADCAGYTASYCLISPAAGQFPSFCTIQGCTAASCSGTYDTCCDCGQSTVPPLAAWGAVCLSGPLEAGLASYGCTCSAPTGDAGAS